MSLRPASFQTAGTGAMQYLEPVFFDLEEGLVAGQLLRGLPARRQGQPRRGVGFNFFQQALHPQTTLGAN